MTSISSSTFPSRTATSFVRSWGNWGKGMSRSGRTQWGKRLVTTLPTGTLLEVFFTKGHPLYKREYDRRVEAEVRDRSIPFISPEDLVRRKLVNTRMRGGDDLPDAFAVAQVQGDELDLDYLWEHCPPHRVCGLVEEIAEEIGQAEG